MQTLLVHTDTHLYDSEAILIFDVLIVRRAKADRRSPGERADALFASRAMRNKVLVYKKHRAWQIAVGC